MSSKDSSKISLPPKPPPLPPPLKPSSFAMKMKLAPPDWFYQPPVTPSDINPLAARAGLYFFYGSLMDPSLLKEILGLETEPKLRPAYLVGYHCKLWGQYPALLDGPTDAIVKGAAYHVKTLQDADRLATYETRHYEARSCMIRYDDGAEPTQDYGFAFTYVGNTRDLSEGDFDLEEWLQGIGRAAVRTTAKS